MKDFTFMTMLLLLFRKICLSHLQTSLYQCGRLKLYRDHFFLAQILCRPNPVLIVNTYIWQNSEIYIVADNNSKTCRQKIQNRQFLHDHMYYIRTYFDKAADGFPREEINASHARDGRNINANDKSNLRAQGTRLMHQCISQIRNFLQERGGQRYKRCCTISMQRALRTISVCRERVIGTLYTSSFAVASRVKNWGSSLTSFA